MNRKLLEQCYSILFRWCWVRIQGQCKHPCWRKRGEGLSFRCTSKGRKDGMKCANFIVGMSHDRGTVICEQYFGSITGDKFAVTVTKSFPKAFQSSKNPKGKLFLMDGCPRKNLAKAQRAILTGASYLKIPA